MIVASRIIASNEQEIADLLDMWQAHWPQAGILALLPEAEQAQLPCLQAACRHRGIALFGAIFPALINAARFQTNGICLLCLAEMPAAFLVDAGNNAAQLIAASRNALSRMPSAAPPPCLFLIFDGMLPNIGSLLHETHAGLGSTVRYAGVNAGSESFTSQPCLFDHERCLSNAVLGLLLPDARVVVEHGYPVSRSLLRATSTSGNRIAHIDNRCAFEAYREVIQQEYGIDLTRENFYHHAAHFPFGLITALDVLVRIPVAFDDEGALFCVGEIPPNAMLRLIRAPTLEDSQCIDLITRNLHQQGSASRLLGFYCAGRRMHFGTAAESELQQLIEKAALETLCGALTLGEIDQLEELDMPRFHNAALVCIPQD